MESLKLPGLHPDIQLWLTGEQGQELGVLLPATLLLTLALGSVIAVPGADGDWGIWGCPSSRKGIILGIL